MWKCARNSSPYADSRSRLLGNAPFAPARLRSLDAPPRSSFGHPARSAARRSSSPTPLRFVWLPGFSLLELLVVIGLIGIVSLSTVPLIKLAESHAVRTMSYQIAAQMEAAKLKAMATRKSAVWTNAALPAPLTLSPQKSATFSETGFPAVGSSGTWTLSAPMAKSKKIIVSSAGRIRIE